MNMQDNKGFIGSIGDIKILRQIPMPLPHGPDTGKGEIVKPAGTRNMEPEQKLKNNQPVVPQKGIEPGTEEIVKPRRTRKPKPEGELKDKKSTRTNKRGRYKSKNSKSKGTKGVVTTVDFDDPTGMKKLKELLFRIAAKKLFLTYPQCPVPIDNVVIALQKTLSPYRIKDYIVVAEDHEDQHQHIHAYVELHKKLDTKSPSRLDLQFLNYSQLDEQGQPKKENYHGQYETAKNANFIIEYITKEIFTPEQAAYKLRVSEGLSKKLGSVYQIVPLDERLIYLASKGEIDVAMKLVEREDPKRYVSQGTQIETRLKELYLKQMGLKTKFPLDSFIIPQDLKEALDLYAKAAQIGENKVLFLQGDSGIGKTQFLRAYFEQVHGLNVLVINHREGLKHFDPAKHQAIIYDDPNFNDETREDLIAMVDRDQRFIKIRYTMVNVPSNVFKAIASNTAPVQVNRNFRDPAVARRVIYARVPKGATLIDTVRSAKDDQAKTKEQLEQEQRFLDQKIQLEKEIEKHNKNQRMDLW